MSWVIFVLINYRDFIVSLQSNIKTDRELLIYVMINLQSHYNPFLSSSDSRDVCKASQEGTILGVIDEVRDEIGVPKR